MKKKNFVIILCIIMIFTMMPMSSWASEEIIIFNSTYNETILTPNDTNRHVITLPTSGRLRIYGQTEVYMDVRLYDEANKQIDRRSFSQNAKNFDWENDLKAGTYYVEFTSGSTGNYNFIASFISANETYACENNNIFDAESLDAIPFNVKINGQIAINDDCDIYKICLPASGKLRLYGQTKVYTNFNLYNSIYKQIYSSAFSQIAKNFNWENDLKAGTYYVEFTSGFTGNYNFTCSLFLPSVKSLKIKSIKKGFSVSAKKNGSINGYEIRYSTNKKNWKIKNYKTNGNLSKKIASLKSKKTYYAQVRKYKKYDEQTLYSKWSAVKKLRTK